jgi:hypothetical protein
MIRKFVGGGFKIPCFYCKTFNIVYPQDLDYMNIPVLAMTFGGVFAFCVELKF